MFTENDYSVTPASKEESTVPMPDTTVIDKQIVDEEPELITGTVVNCRKLNVREQMNTESKVLCTIPVASEVQIIADEVHDDWYHVITASGMEGFCMKNYIQI